MIYIAQEVLKLFTGREGDINAKSGFGVGFGKFVFIEPVSDISFKVVFSDGGFNRAGISEKILSGDFSERDKVFYKRNTDIILKEARKGPRVVVVVEGHPTIYDDVSWDILRRGKKRGFKVKIIPAISCIDAMAAYCGLKIGAAGFQIVEATSLVLCKQKLNPNMDALVMQIGWFGTSLLCNINT